MADVTVARLKQDTGNLLVKDGVNTRLPPITDGLVAYFPCDGRGGTFDKIGGRQASLTTTHDINLVEAMNIDWRDPSSWEYNAGMTWDESKQALKVVGYHNTWIKTPVVIDPNKKYLISVEVMVETRSTYNSGDGYVYAGGYSANAAGERVTTNYDYSLASAQRPPLGEWTKYCLTRTGTGTFGGGHGQTYGTCGWMGDRADITDKLTRNYYLGGLWNYSSGGVMYVRNPSIILLDDDTSSFVYRNEGLGIHDATTNLWTGPFTIYNNFGDSTLLCTMTTLDETYMGQPITRLTIKPLDDTRRDDVRSTYGNHGVYGSYMTYAASTKYWASIYWRCQKSSVTVQGSPTNIVGWTSCQTYAQEDGWNRSYALYYSTGGTDNKFWGVKDTTINTNEVMTIDFACPMIEQKDWATQYGTRSAVSEFSVDGFSLPNFTLAFDFVSDAQYYNDAPSAYNKTLVRMYDADLTRYIAYRDYVNPSGSSVTSSLPFYDLEPAASWPAGTAHWHQALTYTKRKKHTYFMVKNGNTMRILVKDGSTVLADQTFTYTADSTFTNFKLTKLIFGQATETWSGMFSRIAVYNKVLSSDEINKFCCQPFEITTAGNIIARGLIEKPIIPADAIYFPLGVDTKDVLHHVGASEATNLIFEEGSVFTGLGHSNKLSAQQSGFLDGTTSGWAIGNATGGSVTVVEQGTDGNKALMVKVADSGDQFQYTWWDAGADLTGRTFLVGAKVKTYGVTGVCPSIYWINSSWGWIWSNTASSSVVLNGNNGWTTIYAIATAPAGAYRPAFIIGATEGAGGHYWISSAFICEIPYPVPYPPIPYQGAVGSIGQSALEFNLNRDLGLQWGSEWSIIYWKKPVTGWNGSLTGYNIDSLGCNSNSVGGGYLWWGKDNASDNIASSIPSAITPATFFNNWHAVSLVHSGNTLTIKHWNIAGQTYVRTVSLPSTIAANYFVTQYGYDLRLNGWDNVNICPSWYRDLIVIERALPDTELANVVNSCMRAKQDSLQVLGALQGRRLG